MKQFMSIFKSNYENINKMILFNFFKTGDPIYDSIISTFIISFLGFIFNYVYDNYSFMMFCKISFHDIKSVFLRKNTIIIEGKKSSVTSSYSMANITSSLYSDRFKAMWNYIISNIDKNNSIFQIKESHSNFQSSSIDCDEKRKNNDIFMVYQNKYFLISEDIFVKSEFEQEELRDDKEKINTKTDKITIHIYSYKYSVSYLKKYIDNITEKYLSSIKENRGNKRFIYNLDRVSFKESDECILDCWREDIFESYRNFNNIFFDGKSEIISKIDYFLNNREWYIQKGIPYSLGIGLHGPPGTGKTSFIKALANYTNRHIIVMSLKTIKTKRQLEKFFFENTYNDKNENSSVSFEKKIIVFEDIDCVGDIILDRKNKETKKHNTRNKNNNTINKSINIGDVLQSICELNDNGTGAVNSLTNELDITLDDILNLWDGIRETPGRILIISSNHYDKLDPALIRPGRIDITHELSNASHNTISEIYLHLFGNKIDNDILKNVNEYFYSPAELINMFVSYKNEKEFIERLIQNKKI
jgi:SpoVK/Ycf46/Vps4 family AAA+-type ATPase